MKLKRRKKVENLPGKVKVTIEMEANYLNSVLHHILPKLPETIVKMIKDFAEITEDL